VSWMVVVFGAAACSGWAVAVALGFSLRRRLSLAADAEHELRGAAAAIGLAAERLSRTGATAAFSSLVRLQLDRMAAALHDLAAVHAPRPMGRGTAPAPRRMGRATPLASRRLVRAPAHGPRRVGAAAPLGDEEMDAGRLAQVLGNLIANATEHGTGAVDVRASRPAGAVRIEIRNRNRPRELDDARAARAAGRGRGLAIAERAAHELGGRLTVESDGRETRAELELPAPDAKDGGSRAA
jgi:signal transduction histidine kinase